MEPVLQDKYQVAWFRLAEFVDRGERERALGVLRLLTHTVHDGAFAKQLEADLYLFFADARAVEYFQEAARLYCAQNNVVQAVAIYEQLVRIRPQCDEFFEKLVVLYQELGHPIRTFLGFKQLITPLVKSGKYELLRAVFTQKRLFLPNEKQAKLMGEIDGAQRREKLL